MVKPECVVCHGEMVKVSVEDRVIPIAIVVELMNHDLSPAVMDLYECKEKKCCRAWCANDVARELLPKQAAVELIETA